MKTREQRYALRTMTRMEAVVQQPQAVKTQYGALCHKLPVLIHSAGLVQALAFLYSRTPEPSRTAQSPGKTARNDEDLQRMSSAHHQLLMDLAWVLADDDHGCSAGELLVRAQTVHLTEYMQLTRLSLAALVWFKRYAQSLLQVEASDADDARSLSTAGGIHE